MGRSRVSFAVGVARHGAHTLAGLLLVGVCISVVCAAEKMKGSPAAGSRETLILDTRSYWRLHTTVWPLVYGWSGETELLEELLNKKALDGPKKRLELYVGYKRHQLLLALQHLHRAGHDLCRRSG